ncbi:hypothetical protein BSFG_02587 [Bacteroides sp. 4_3_47FAA]|nr:hypothetical protein BSFG_02587 [Bacteroides sp. 4_3_47FAA]
MRLYLTGSKMGVRTLDYMRQFWRENEMQMFSAKETQLYFFLLAEYNRRYWQNPFGCSTQRIANNIGISRQTLCRLREKLKERGLITYEEGKNNSSIPSYTLLIKPDNRTTLSNVTANGTQDETASVTADGTIIRTYNKSITSNQEELFPLNKLKSLLCCDCNWLGNVREYANKQGMKLNEANMQDMLAEFFLYLQTCGIQSKTVTDAQRHFVNWLMKKGNSRNNGQKTLPASQIGVKLTDNSPDKFKDTSEW